MFRLASCLRLAAPLILLVLPLAAETDKPGSKDHPLVSRMQSMHITSYRSNPFDRFQFRTGKGHDDQVAVEGKFFEIRYKTDEGGVVPSPLAIMRNYQQALRAVGGTVVFEDNRYTNIKVTKGGQETWIQVDTAWGKGYQLTIVEKAAMAQEVVATAAAMGGDLKAAGHVAVYGIQFDTNRSEVKPESEPALEQIARLLKQDPGLRLKVVGHTDMTGSFDANMKLSQARGEAVVQALVTRHGIAPGRLKGYGVGPLVPVATNESEAGRALNRRVDLVRE